MLLKRIIPFLLSLVLIAFSFDADAQRNKYKKRRQTNKAVSKYRGGRSGWGRFIPYTFYGANINAGNYFGDLAPASKAGSTDISFTRPGFGAFIGYKFHNMVAVRASFNWIRIAADDFTADPGQEESFQRYARNLSFRNDIKELSAGFKISLIANHGSFQQRPPINAFMYIGAAAILHEPRGKVPEFDYQADPSGNTPAPNAGEWVKLRELGTEGQNIGIVEPYSNLTFAIPITLGAELRIPRTNFSAGLEAGIRYTFTDYLDDVSTNYVADLNSLDPNGTNPLARIMSDRSAEPTSSNGDARITQGISYVTDQNGYRRWIGAASDLSIRGGADNDYYFVTQLSLTYFVDTTKRRAKKGRGRAKFR
jgi:hypothetical protein